MFNFIPYDFDVKNWYGCSFKMSKCLVFFVGGLNATPFAYLGNTVRKNLSEKSGRTIQLAWKKTRMFLPGWILIYRLSFIKVHTNRLHDRRWCDGEKMWFCKTTFWWFQMTTEHACLFLTFPILTKKPWLALYIFVLLLPEVLGQQYQPAVEVQEKTTLFMDFFISTLS